MTRRPWLGRARRELSDDEPPTEPLGRTREARIRDAALPPPGKAAPAGYGDAAAGSNRDAAAHPREA